ncbi:hypothetical protein G9A89_021784 [Geosiphon pyriformis]|nr:hypothetical protein G9A89_021784 [Geosiphon pyriformis]
MEKLKKFTLFASEASCLNPVNDQDVIKLTIFEITSEKQLRTRYKSINDLMIDENFSLIFQLGWTELRRHIGHRRKGIPPAHNLSFVGHGLGGVFAVLGAFELLTVKHLNYLRLKFTHMVNLDLETTNSLIS